MNDRQDTEQDLQATSESIKADARRLLEIEHAKTALEPTDPKVDQLSDQAVRIAERTLDKTRIERELSRDLGAQTPAQGDAPSEPPAG